MVQLDEPCDSSSLRQLTHAVSSQAGPWSDIFEVVSGAGVPDPPKPPVVYCRSAHGAVVSWEEPVNNGATVTEYRLEWQYPQDGGDFAQVGVSTVIVVTTLCMCVLTLCF